MRGVRVAVDQAGPGDDLAPDQVGQPLADGRPGPRAVVPVEVRRDTARGRGFACLAMQRDDQVGAQGVGQLGPLDLVRVGVGGPAEDGQDAGRGQAALDPAGEVQDDAGLVQLVPARARVAAPVSRVDDDDPCRPGSVRPGAPVSVSRSWWAAPPLTDRVSSWARARRVDGPQVPSGTRPTPRWSSRRAPSVDGPNRPSTRPTWNPRPSSWLLQLGDVVAGQQVSGRVHQDPVAERPAGAVQGPVGLRTDDAVGEQARRCWKARTASATEPSYVERAGRGRVGGTGSAGSDGGQVPGGGQPVPDVPDGGVDVAERGRGVQGPSATPFHPSAAAPSATRWAMLTLRRRPPPAGSPRAAGWTGVVSPNG